MFSKIMMATIAATGLASAASATAFDFESVSFGLYSPLSLSADGLGLTVTTEGYAQGFVHVRSPNVPGMGQVAVLGTKTAALNVGNFAPLRFAFDHQISSITFSFGDGGGDSDSPVLVEAYASGGAFLGSATTGYGPNFGSLKSLTLAYAGASYFIASSGTDSGNDNSLYWDVSNVVSSSAVPEPASWAMMLGGFGLIGGVLRSSRRTMLSFA